LLDRLVAEKLEAEAAAVHAEGWKWVETRPSFDYADWSEFRRRHEESVPLSAEAEAELQGLSELHRGARIQTETAEPIRN